MNPEILFRGKRVDNGEWVEGYYLPKYDITLPGLSKTFILKQNEVGDVLWIEVDPTTICRYTGLTDKNGVKIFLGDIVESEDKIIYDEIFRFQVCFGICGGTQNVSHEVGYMGFYLQPVRETDKKYTCLGIRNDIVFWIKQREGIKVIGNIHDNPELLGEVCHEH